MKPYRSFVFGGLSLTISRVIIFALGLLASIWITRYLGPDLYGQYAQMLWLGGTAGMLIIFGFANGLTRFVSEMQANSDSGVAGGLSAVILCMVLGMGVVVALFLGAGATRVASLIGLEDKTYVWAAVPSLILAPVLTLFSAFLGGRHQFTLAAIIAGVAVIVNTVAQLGLLFLGANVQALVIVNSLGGAFALILFLHRLRQLNKATPLIWPDRILWKRFFRYSVVMGLVFVTDAVVWQRSEMFFLGHFNLVTQAGFYSLAYSLAGTAIMIIPGSVGVLTMPLASTSRALGGKQGLEYIFQISLRFTALLALPIAVLAGLVGPFLITKIYGLDYAASGQPLVILVWGSLAGVIAWNGASVLQAGETPKILLLIGLIGGLINITLDLLLIRNYEATGAAIANTVTAFCVAVAVLFAAKHQLELQFPFRILLRVFGASFLAWLPAWLIVRQIPLTYSTVIMVTIVFLAAYLVLIVVTRAILPEEINAIKNLLKRSSIVEIESVEQQ